VTKLKKRVREIDDVTITRLEQVFFGLADKTRLKILRLMTREELCACEVMAALGLTQPTTSHHLGILERSRLITSRHEGKWVFYRLAGQRTQALLAKASELAGEAP
jgi:ArsR family transcriptional regulator